MVFSEAHAVRADQLTKVCAPPHGLCVVILEILLLSGSEEVVEDAKPLIVAYGFQPGVQPGEALVQVALHPAEVCPALLNFPLGDGQGDIPLLYQIVALSGAVAHDLIGFLPEVVKPVAFVGQQYASLELCRVQPMVHDGDLGGSVSRQRVQRAAVCRKDAALGLLGGRDVIYICQLPCAAVLAAHLPDAVGVNTLDGDGLLNTFGYSQLVPFTLICCGKRSDHRCHFSFPKQAS